MKKLSIHKLIEDYSYYLKNEITVWPLTWMGLSDDQSYLVSMTVSLVLHFVGGLGCSVAL